MTEIGRRTLTHPLLLQVENVAQEALAHLGRYRALWLALVAAMLVGGFGLFTGLQRLAFRWDYPYDHSWLVLGMTGWLLLRALRTADIGKVQPSFAGLAALLLSVLLYCLCEVLDVSLGMHVMLPLILFALITTLAGVRVARAAAVPLAMLYFTIPIWDLTIPPLQAITTAVVATLVSWTGPVAYTVGNVITIPAGSFEIAEGCSGMRYFMVSLAITAFIGLSWYQRWRTRFLLLAVAGLSAMVSNWIRIYTLILIGDATDMKHYVIAVSHDGYGWLVYVVFLLPVLWFARVLDKREAMLPQASAVAPPAADIAPAKYFALFGLLTAAILAAPAFIRGGNAVAGESPQVHVMPHGGSGWIPVETSDTWKPSFQAPYFAAHEALMSERDVHVDLFVARYLRQRPGSKLVSTHNLVNPDWQVTARREHALRIGHDTRRVLEAEISRGSERRLVWQWYLVGGESTHDRVRAKMLEVSALIRGRRDGAVIALSAPCGADCQQAAAEMDDLVRVAGARLESLANGAVDAVP
jgi:EpsI family protein